MCGPTCGWCGGCCRRRPGSDAKHLIRNDDLASVRVTSDTPVACQIDGDYIGLRDDMTFRSVPEALGVVAPAAEPLTSITPPSCSLWAQVG